MNEHEIKTKIAELIDCGVARSWVFSQLAGQGIKDSHLAHLIASHPDPRLCRQHDGKVTILVALAFFQAAIAFLVSFGIDARHGANLVSIVGAVMAIIHLYFAWCLHKHIASAYSAYLLLLIIQLPQQLESFAWSPFVTVACIAISAGMFGFVVVMRRKLFPDFLLVTPKRVSGQYVFAS